MIPTLHSSVVGLALLGLTSGSAIGTDVSTNNLPTKEIWISSLEVPRIEQGWGEGRANRSVDNRRLTVAERVFQRAAGTHANCILRLELDGNAVELPGWAGADPKTLLPMLHRFPDK